MVFKIFNLFALLIVAVGSAESQNLQSGIANQTCQNIENSCPLDIGFSLPTISKNFSAFELSPGESLYFHFNVSFEYLTWIFSCHVLYCMYRYLKIL
jgi:hypothetical protein